MGEETRVGEEDLRIVIQQVSRAIRINRGDDVSDSQLAVLFHLETRGPLTPSELAALERVTPPSMNRTVNGLAEAGLVTRTPSSADARKVDVDITPAAVELLAETRRLRTAWFSRRFATLDEPERAALLDAVPLLRKLIAP